LAGGSAASAGPAAKAVATATAVSKRANMGNSR
jgi:hypothetical protein